MHRSQRLRCASLVESQAGEAAQVCRQEEDRPRRTPPLPGCIGQRWRMVVNLVGAVGLQVSARRPVKGAQAAVSRAKCHIAREASGSTRVSSRCLRV